jgi:aminopeptidase-like protein
MLLEALRDDATAAALTEEAFGLMRSLWPLCRSITGPGLRATLDQVHAWAPLERSEVPTGTPVFDWEVPKEWTIRDAWVAHADDPGTRLIDFRAHNLHVVNYSTPVRACLTRAELEPHLHSTPGAPDRIPYRTSYYREQWGFCLRHADRERLGEGPFDVVIDADLAPGHLSYGECVVEGECDDEALVYTHVCHPSLANDNLTGIALAAALARALRQGPRPRLTWRFVFAPGTIGSLTWLSRNEHRLPRVRAGLVIGLLGDGGALTFKQSRRGDTLVDRAAALVMAETGGRTTPFEPYGYDERQFCSPGFDLPVGRLTRTPNGLFPEYHSSADDLAFVQPLQLQRALQALARLVGTLDANRTWRNLSPKGEPRLGKRGLYGMVGGGGPGQFEHALLWLLNQSDGRHDLIDIAERSRLPFEVLAEAAEALQRAGLLAEARAGDPPLSPYPSTGTRR